MIILIFIDLPDYSCLEVYHVYVHCMSDYGFIDALINTYILIMSSKIMFTVFVFTFFFIAVAIGCSLLLLEFVYVCVAIFSVICLFI